MYSFLKRIETHTLGVWNGLDLQLNSWSQLGMKFWEVVSVGMLFDDPPSL